MHETYRNMSSIVELDRISYKSLSELAIALQRKGNDTMLIANLFVMQYRYLRAIGNNFYNITAQDKGSIAMEEVYRAAKAYDPRFETKLETLTCKYYMNGLLNHLKNLSAGKRGGAKDDFSFDGILQEISMISQEQGDLLRIELEYMIANEKHLTENEKNFCIIVLNHPYKMTLTEIAQMLKISVPSVQYIRERLQSKVRCLIV